MLYKVTKQYARGSNEILIAEFMDASDAKIFIQGKLLEDARVKIKVTYRILEGMDVLEEFTEADIISSGGSGGSSGAGAGSQQRSNFQPTPLNMSPRPPGSPPNWLKDDEADDKSKK
ncbi:MAG TPA: hypothetical protein VLI69_09345 [Gammaproteobacteria bacterium]|nr:hypothetical protein [Gammaproteobacteria bacterium]